MKAIAVRPIKEKDIYQAVEIHKKIIRGGLGQEMNYAIEELFKSFIKKSPQTCLIAEKDKKIVGFIIGEIKKWRFGVERSGWIEMIEVDPHQMGKGIGTALGKAFIKYFKEKKIKEIYTTVEWDSGDLIAFFKSIGFEKSSVINLEHKSK